MIGTMLLAVGLATGLATAAEADELKVMTWNISGGEQSLAELEDNARALVEQLGPIDIAVIDEVIESDQVEAIANGLRLDHWVQRFLAAGQRLSEFLVRLRYNP